MPVYNSAPFLKEAINSILQQSFSDFELIVINDGSSDSSGKILRQYATQDLRIHLVERENRGLPITRNEAVALARGEWLALMDSDDIAAPTRLERQLKFSQDNNLSVCGSGMILFGRNKEKLKYYPESDLELKYNIYFWGASFANPTVFIRREVFDHCSYQENYRFAEDTALWFQIVSIPGVRLGNVPEPLLRYRQHDQQTTVLNQSEANDRQQYMTEMMTEALKAIELEASPLQVSLHVRAKLSADLSQEELACYLIFIVALERRLSELYGDAPGYAANYWGKVLKKHYKYRFFAGRRFNYKKIKAQTE
jgi:glycosyltransferase involved in cell wall biosynthesis